MDESRTHLRAPFPYFGGKANVAKYVWQALGEPKHYVEPFFGSGAVLLSRPNYDPTKHVETICDKDGFVANVWRALQFKPDEVAEWCDWPVNHADLCARRRKLLANQERLLENLIADDEWCDPKLAGYWIWAASCWIGSGLTRPNAIPDISHGGKGIHAVGKRQHIGRTGSGVHAIGQIPHLADTGRCINAIGQIPKMSHGGNGIHSLVCRADDAEVGHKTRYNTNIYRLFSELSQRMRYVRVVCGDWKRVCGGNWQDHVGDVGIFFDPPYGVMDRDINIYHCDSTSIADQVREWCLERGSKPTYRIVLAGYEEHESLLEQGWTMMQWKAKGGYSNISHNNKNRHRERLYFSPHCTFKPTEQLKLNNEGDLP